jgi:hypothetical protein
MPPMKINRDSFADFKIALRELCPGLRSAHADEVLASGFGFRTYASLTAAFSSTPDRPIEVAYDMDCVMSRLRELGHAISERQVGQLFRRHAELGHERIWESIRSMALRPANDNASSS